MNQMLQKPGAQPLLMNPMMQMMPTPVFPVPQTNEATLYVGNLNSALEETRLMNIFQPFGQVVSCRIMRDLYSHESRRFGFVSFSNVTEAQKAKESLNYKSIDGFEIRICFKRSPSDFKPEANVFIRNLPKATTTRELDEVCNQFGRTVSCSIRTDSAGNSLGYGYAQFDDEAAARKAIDGLNVTDFKGTRLEAKQFVASKNRAVNKTNVYIKNFPLKWNQERVEQEMQKQFGALGAINCMAVKEHKTFTGESRFYAFVAFEAEEAAKNAIDQFNGKFLDPENKAEGEEPVYAVFVQPKRIRESQLAKEHLNYQNTTNLFIKSLKESVTEEDLSRIFGKYGKITSLICKPTKPIFLGGNDVMKFAYVNFAQSEDANEAYLKGKHDPEIKELLHAAHKPTFDFISYHQPKAIRAQYLRIKNRMKAAMFLPPQFGMSMGMKGGPFPFKKKGPRFNDNMGMPGGFPFGQPNVFPVPGFMPFLPDVGGMGMMNQAQPITSPSTFNNSTPSNSSRPGEKKEDFNVEWLKKNKKEFLGMDKERQNNILGNLMYNRVLGSGLTDRDLVPKVTGMLIDLEILDYEEIIDILVNDESLKDRISEAVEVINETPANN